MEELWKERYNICWSNADNSYRDLGEHRLHGGKG